jgi:hypothetical protein
MIFDHRTYTCRPGTIQKQLELYEKNGLHVQVRHLGEPVLYGLTETGPLNTYVHVWAYENAGDRERRRGAMAADPEWQSYLKLSHEAGYLIGQENKILTAPGFFKLKS